MGCLNVGVVGTGLIGGSIALAGIRAGYRVFVYESGGSAVHTILGQAIRATDLANLAESSDLVFIATPISVITDIAKTLASGIRPGSLVSDVASVKGPVFRALSEIFGQRCFYIPSHPMAGSEKSGLEAARVNLFEGAVTLLCPDACPDQSALERLSQFWKRAGSSPLVLDVPTHDRLVAAVSHLPHLLAAILMLHATRSAPEGLSLSGGGFRDSTRIAAGSPDLWKEILLANRSDLLTNLYRYRGAVDEAIQILEANDAKRLQALLDAAKTNREKLSG
ncbi:MAG: prephenate dehydrogenase/arogenate dehydrogenase family protein [Verrucomicrobia bacterium]|nr:prephenate dehydrogenase/arogenate dehydrogenase family protein [Verrucomicrobiota bacterium]